MRLKLTLVRAGVAPVDLALTSDATARVSDIAAALHSADPARGETSEIVAEGSLTLRVVEPGSVATPRTLDPASNLLESGLRSGVTVEIVRAENSFVTTGADRGPAAAVLKVISGADAGREFSLPFGTSYLGRDRGVDVRLSDTLVSKRHARITVGETVEIVDTNSANGLLIGGEQVARAVLRAADIVAIGDTEICIVPLQRTGGVPPTSPAIEFVRPPRSVPRFPGGEILAPAPPKSPQRARFPYLAIVAPIIMGVVLYLVTRQLMAVVFVALSPLLVIGAFVDQAFTSRRTLKSEEKRFDGAMLAAQSTLDAAQVDERRVRIAESPSVAESVDALTRMGPLVWTRRPEHGAFLTARLGTGTAPSRTTVKLPNSNDTLPKYWTQLEQLASGYSRIDDVPVTVDWRVSGALGLAGARAVLDGVARGVVLQVAALHSPAELVIAAFASPTSRGTWEWLEWLPHTSSAHSPLSGDHLAANQGSGAVLLARLEALVDSRLTEAPTVRGELDPAKPAEKDAPIVPAVIVVVENDAIVDRGRITRLAERGADANVHIIWCAASVEQLPAVCRTFLTVDTTATGAIVGEVRIGERLMPIATESLDLALAHQLARALAPVTDVGSPIDDDSDLPRAVSYVSLAGAELASEAGTIADRWRENNSITVRDGSAPVRRKKEGNLRALVGHAGAEPFYLDVRTQGPHALVGGTTGAGKSEFLQSWVLGMAAAHSPDRATFLFIDYKGGAAFAECVDLPHTVGLVTDLSPHLVRRALTSLRAELRYREHLLNRKKAKDLVSLEKTGDPETPPSLLIVVDEFAALVQEVPEFVDGIVDVAQRGRSLGLHLILATQRPAGVIKDNLRANTNLRIALRMADAEDSSDILGTPMAAHFDPSIPGRGAAKTGPGRIATFQTGYAGGWTTNEPQRPRIDITELSFGSGVSWDLPEVEVAEVRDPGPNDIARIVATIGRAAVDTAIPLPRKPWLDELAPIYDFSQLPNPRTDDKLLLGVLDDPASQSQPTAFYSPDRDGNMAIFGTGGSGKSATLRSIAVAAAVTPRGGPVHVYGLDFGANGLKMLENLPHVGAIVSGDDDERVVRLLRTLRDLVDERTKKFAAVNADTIGEYRLRAAAPNEPRILLLVDGIAAFREAYEYSASSPWFTVFSQIAADGRQLGVHVVMTGDRPNAIPPSISSTVQRRIVLRLASEEDYVLLGEAKDVLSPASPPGRGIIEGNEVQIAIFGASSNVAIQARELGRFAESVRRQNLPPAPPIGRLPDSLSLGALPAALAGLPVIGLSDESLSAIGLEPRGALMLAGPPGSGRTTALASIAAALRRAAPTTRVAFFSPRKTSLSRRAGWDFAADSVESAVELASRLRAEIASGMHGEGTLAVLVESITEFAGSDAEFELDQLIRACVRDELFVVGESESSTWQQAWMLAQPFKAARRGLLLSPGESDGDALLGTPLARIKRSEFPPGRGFLIAQGRAVRLQVAVEETR